MCLHQRDPPRVLSGATPNDKTAKTAMKDPDELSRQLDDYDSYVDRNQPIQVKPTGRTLSCGAGCAKRTLLSMNLLFLLLGVGIIIATAYARDSEAVAIESDKIILAALVLGAFVMVISLLGCCAAHMESRALLLVYMFILAAMVFAQLAVSVLVLVDAGRAKGIVRDYFKDLDEDDRRDVQNDFNCCGLKYNDSYAVLPCPSSATEGCEAVVSSELEDKLTVAGAVAIAFGLAQICGIVMAVALRKGVLSADYRRQDETVRAQA